MSSSALSLHVPISKLDEELRMVYGYASTPDLDSHGERITVEALEQALPGYMQFANIREMHQPSAVGKTKQAHVDEGGMYIQAKIVDDVAWAKVKEGVYSAFSIGGFVNKRKGETITDLELVEISLVDRPANPNARIDIWKSAAGRTPQFWWMHYLPTQKTISLTNLLKTMSDEQNTTPEDQTPAEETPEVSPGTTGDTVPADETQPEEKPEDQVDAPADQPEEKPAEDAAPAEPAPSESPDVPEDSEKALTLKDVEQAIAKAIAPVAQDLADLKGRIPVKKSVEPKSKASFTTVTKGEEDPTPEETEVTGLKKRHGELLDLKKSLSPSEYERRYGKEAQALVAKLNALKVSL